MENVPGIANVEGFSTFRRFLRLLVSHGYRYAFDVLDAKCFGVPQNRRRLVLIAMKERQPSLPAAKFGGLCVPSAPSARPYHTSLLSKPEQVIRKCLTMSLQRFPL